MAKLHTLHLNRIRPRTSHSPPSSSLSHREHHNTRKKQTKSSSSSSPPTNSDVPPPDNVEDIKNRTSLPTVSMAIPTPTTAANDNSGIQSERTVSRRTANDDSSRHGRRRRKKRVMTDGRSLVMVELPFSAVPLLATLPAKGTTPKDDVV